MNVFNVKRGSRLKFSENFHKFFYHIISSLSCVIRVALCSFLMDLIWFLFSSPAYWDMHESGLFSSLSCPIFRHLQIRGAYLEHLHTFFTSIAQKKSKLCAISLYVDQVLIANFLLVSVAQCGSVSPNCSVIIPYFIEAYILEESQHVSRVFLWSLELAKSPGKNWKGRE